MIKIKNLYKSYDNKEIFKNLNLNIESGEMVAIIGKSGSGKSTLLNIIGGLEKADSGDIYIENKKISWNNNRVRTEMFRNVFGYLFQNYALIDNKTVSENLDVALKYSKDKNKYDLKMNALKKVSLSDKLNTKVFKLSGGEQQRIALAKLILKESKIILADEPTASVDKETGDKIFNLLRELNKDKTIIVVTHDNYIASLCDRIIDINKA